MNRIRTWFYAMKEGFGFGESPYIRRLRRALKQEEVPTVWMTDVGWNSDGECMFFTFYSDGSSTERPCPGLRSIRKA